MRNVFTDTESGRNVIGKRCYTWTTRKCSSCSKQRRCFSVGLSMLIEIRGRRADKIKKNINVKTSPRPADVTRERGWEIS